MVIGRAGSALVDPAQVIVSAAESVGALWGRLRRARRRNWRRRVYTRASRGSSLLV